MTTDEFSTMYNAKYTKETPIKTPLAFDGYTLKFKDGSIYIHSEELKPDHKIPTWRGLENDDFIYRNYWNGELII